MAIRRRAILMAKEESVYGTDPTPVVASNTIPIFNPTLNPVGAKVTRNWARETISQAPSLLGSRYYELTFETEVYMSNAAGTATRYGDLFEACGMTETISGGVSVTYKPNSLGTSAKSVTLYVNFDGRLHKLTGCMGTWEMIGQAGQPVRIRWTFRGVYNVPTDTAISTPTYEATVNAPPKLLGSSFTFNALSSLVVQQISINIGNRIANREDVNATHGYKGFVIADRQASANINPESMTVATYDAFADWIASAQRQLSFVLGSGAGNILTVTLPKCVIDDIRQGDADGVERFEIPLHLAYSTADDEIQLVFT